MSVTKKSGFAGPYRSQTFRLNYDEIVGRNGVMTMNGEVTESAGIISIPPFTFIQQGLIVTSDSVKTVNKPSLVGPYFLVISSPTTIQVDDLVISFAASPRDIQANEVLVAEWDGNEWRQLPFVSIDEVIKATEQDRLDYGWGGPVNGLITSVSGLSYKNTKGIIIDRNGMKTRLDEDAYLTQYADDPEATWTRVDRIVYRRQQDGDRVGVRKTLLGGTYTLGPQVLSGPQIKTNSAYHPRTKVAVDNANIGYVMTVEGFGASFTLWLTRLLADRSGVDFATTQVSGVTATTDEIDFAIDPVSGDCHFVYVNSGNIYFIRTDKNANVLNGPVAIDTQSQPCSNPRILRDSSGKFLITYQALLAPLNNQLYFASCDNTGATITGAKRIVNTATNIINQDMFVTPDLYLYVAYEDQTLGKIYYDIYDDIGNAINPSPVWLSQNVVSTSYGTNTDNAFKPKVRVSDSGDMFITFLQVRGGVSGIVIVKNQEQAYSPDLLGAGVEVTDYDFQVSDLLNDLLFYVNEPTSGSYRAMVSGEGSISQSAVVLNSEIVATQAKSLAMIFDRTGSLLMSKTDADPGTYTDVDGPQTLAVIGPATLVGTNGTISLAANQVMFDTGSLTHAPVIGEQMTISGATDPLNDGAQLVQDVQTANYNSTGDATIITVPVAYNSSEEPVVSATSQFAIPDGMAVDTFKASSEQDQARALRKNTLPCDVLLSRILVPGPVILNYLQNPVFSGGVSTQAQQVAIHGESPVDWEGTAAGNFTISADFGIMDLLNYVDYTVQAGSYAMAEDEALYVRLDGVNTTLTPIVANIAVLPWSEPIQVLGYVKDGDFNPVLLSIGGGETLSSGETIVIGSDLPTPIRSRLGIIDDLNFQPYTSVTEVGANDTYPEAISNLDKSAGQVRVIDLIDLVSTSLPAGPSATIDGVSLTNGMKVVFTKAPIAGAYTVSGVGTSITFTQFKCFKGLYTPFNGAMIRVAQGTSYVSTLWTYSTNAWKVIETSSATSENTGIVDRSQSTISFDDGTKTFTIAPVGDYFDFIIHNVLFRKNTAQTILLPDTDGVKYIYFDNTGTLQYQNSFDETLLKDKTYVATVYWNVAAAKGILADERHGIIMDYNTHTYLHNTQGAKIQTGFSPSYTTAGTGATDADCQIQVSNGILRDEDLVHDIQDGVQQDLAPIAQIPVFYRSGVTGVWTWDAATNVPLKAGTLRPKFNNPTGWTLDDTSADGKFIAMFVLVTNFAANPVISIMGQAEYDTLSDAQAGAVYQNLSMGDFITQEAKLAYRLIFETSSAFGNTTKASLRDVQDYRAGADLYGTPAANVTDHGLLSGLDDPDHGPTAVTTVGVTKDGGLSASDTDLEQALDTLNKTLGQLRLKPHPSNTKRLIVTGAKRVLNDGTTLVQKLRSFVLSFDGAQIDFATKQIFEADGVTPFGGGATFTYTFPATGQWKWLALSITTSSMSGLNEVIPKFLITEAASTAGTQATAPKATFAGGTGIGEVAVQGSGSDIAALTTANINSIGVAGGGGSGGASPKIVGGGTVSLETIVIDGFSIGTGFDAGTEVAAVQANGQILVGGSYFSYNGNSRSMLVRLNADGTEDTGFYANLGTGFNNTINTIAVQPNGQILVGGLFSTFNGNTRNRLVRLNSDGTEDTGFYTNLGTGFDQRVYTVAVQANNQILVGGVFESFNSNTRYRLVRLNSDGTEDTGFYTNLGTGFFGVGQYVYNIAVQSNNQILVGGSFTTFSSSVRERLIRLNSDGTQDSGFYSSYGGLNGPVYRIAIQPNGQILLGGIFTSNGLTRNRLVRLNSTGAEDTGFYANLGTAFNAGVYAIAVQSDGLILVGGWFTALNGNTRNRLVRLNANGTEDTGFYTNLGTGFNNTVQFIVNHPNGQILVGGGFTFFNGNARDRLASLNVSGTETPAITVNTADLSYTSDFYVEVPGLAYTDNTIQTALSPITFTADKQAAYVVPNSSTGGPALPVTVTTLPNVPSDAVILARREGTEVIVGSSSTRFVSGEHKKLYAGVSDELLSVIPAASAADKTGQLRLLANSTPNKKVNVSAVSKIVPDGTEYGIQIKNLLLSFGGAVIDFSTGVITDQLGGALGVNFTPATIAASQYRWYSVTLVPANVGTDGKISGQLVVIAGSADGATAAAAPRAAFATGIQLGQVVVQESGGSIAVISQSNIVQLSAGGSGSGTGDANSLMEDIKARLRDGPFLWATPNIISLQAKTLIDTVNSTASYDIANSWYKIDSGQTLRSIQQFGAQFLASTRDCAEVEVNLGYDITGIDPAPNVFVSRNGGNAWQQVTMDQVGASNKLRGSLTFAAEANQVLSTYAIANADGAAILGNTIQAVAQPFTPASKVQMRKISLSFTKLGSPIGNVNLKIVKDSAGSPSSNASDIVYSTIMSATSFAAGTNTRAIDVSTILTPGQTYWIVLDTDALYKTNNLGVDNIQVREDSSSPGATLAKQYNGSVWNTAVYALVYIFEGITYDLRLRIDSTTNGSKLLGYGIFFGRQSAGTIVAGTPKQMRTTFSGSDNVYSFTLPFTPDPDFLRVYDVQSGQVYVYPTFDISGNVVTFLSGTFLVPGTSITLLFDQSMGTGYDNSDKNRALLAENGIGSQNGAYDLSSPGIGLKLRSSGGQLWHITVTDAGAILTTPITG